MKIILVAVTSLNGKLTKGNDPHIYTWTSPEDQEYFFDLISQNNLLVMGRGTYEAVKENIKLNPRVLRIVLTKQFEQYSKYQVKNQLEFSSESPLELVKRMSEKGYTQLLLVGGSEVHTSFLKAGLVDEIYLTIEPKLFGRGKNIFAEGEVEADLELMSYEKINKKGTILLKYKVTK